MPTIEIVGRRQIEEGGDADMALVGFAYFAKQNKDKWPEAMEAVEQHIEWTRKCLEKHVLSDGSTSSCIPLSFIRLKAARNKKGNK